MKITAGGNLPLAAEVTRGYPVSNPVQAQVQREETDLNRRFDSVTISDRAGRRSSFEREVRSRLKQEVRSSPSPAAIAALREQVQNGTYQPDPMQIARKMLLWEEAV